MEPRARSVCQVCLYGRVTLGFPIAQKKGQTNAAKATLSVRLFLLPECSGHEEKGNFLTVLYCHSGRGLSDICQGNSAIVSGYQVPVPDGWLPTSQTDEDLNLIATRTGEHGTVFANIVVGTVRPRSSKPRDLIRL